MKKSLVAFCAATSIAVGQSAMSAVVPLTNGSFESPTLSAGTPFTSTPTGWSGTSIGGALASSFGLTATQGTQVGYCDSAVGSNLVLFQDAATTTLQANTIYTFQCDLRPLVNDATNNCALITLAAAPSFTTNYADAGYRTSALSPGSFSSTDAYTLTFGQWTRVVMSFNSANFASQVSANDTIRIIIRGHKLAVDNVRLYAGPNDYYVSQSTGNDANDGLSPATAWQTFENLRNRTLSPGDKVLLKRGDTWANSNLTLTGKGTSTQRITLSAYGTGARPLITGADVTTATCITINNASYFDIDSMDCRTAKVGLYLRYKGDTYTAGGSGHNNKSVTVRSCNFQKMDYEWSNSSGVISVQPPYELSWGAGIWLGGTILGGAPDNQLNVLDGLTIEHCSFNDCSTGYGNNWYYPGAYRQRVKNVLMQDCWATGCENGIVAIFDTDTAVFRRIAQYVGGNGFYNTGTTNGFVQGCQNVLFDDCEFGFAKRNSTGNDGVAFDYEGDTTSVTLTNSVLHDCDGGAMIILSTNGNSLQCNVTNNTIYNNCRNPNGSGQNREFNNSSSNNSGTITGNGIYLGAATAAGTPILQNNVPPSTRWQNFTGAYPLTSGQNRTGTAFSAVSSRPTTWDFASSVDGWSGFSADWGSAGASGGNLTGTSTGADPYAESPATWANVHRVQTYRVRMAVTAGTFGQVFFQTETDPTWNSAKSVSFALIPDGQMRDYLLNMRVCSSFKGVVTKVRLDPTDVAGATFQVDKVELLSNPIVTAVAGISNQTVDVLFSEAMDIDGGVLNRLNYAVSGPGLGTCSSTPDTVTPVSTPNGTAYRLGWNSGTMTNAGVNVTVSNALDPLGFPVFTGSAAAGPSVPVRVSGLAFE